MSASIPCGLLTFDDDLRIRDANPMACDLLRRPRAALLEMRLPDLLPRAERLYFQSQVHPALALKGRVAEIYLRLRTGDGEDVPVVLEGTRTVTDGDPRSTLAFLTMRRRQLFEHELVAARDAAEAAARLERQAQAEVKQAQAKLALQERLASLGTLASGIAHEINNPLTYVDAGLEMIAEALRSDEPVDRADLLGLATDALEGTRRIREITGQMGDLLRADEMPRVTLDPRTVASLVARMTRVHTRARARVELDLQEVPLVEADAGRLGQVLVNLVVNAVHAFGERPAEENLVRIVTRTGAQGEALVEVQDNGPGIPAEVAARVFEPFFTTKPVGQGTGLGLSLSNGLVTSLDGTLTFDTEPGRGTTFRVALPASRAPRPAAPPVSPVPSAPSQRRVLVVDDDRSVARAIARALGRYDVTIALSADEALVQLRSTPFDFVLTDVKMPGRDGLALYDAIAAGYPHLARRVAFVSGAPSEAARQRIASLGLPIFGKPLDVAALLAFCDELLPADDATPRGGSR
ncbi:MAG: ATP-binding protein [Myxococcota bacterium]